MTEQEKLAALEDMMELDAGTLASGTSLDDIDEWDSLSALSFVILLKDTFGRKVSGKEIREMRTVGDLMRAMEPVA